MTIGTPGSLPLVTTMLLFMMLSCFEKNYAVTCDPIHLGIVIVGKEEEVKKGREEEKILVSVTLDKM